MCEVQAAAIKVNKINTLRRRLWHWVVFAGRQWRNEYMEGSERVNRDEA